MLAAHHKPDARIGASSAVSEPSPGVSRAEALDLALNADLDRLMDGADALRRATFGDDIELCAIINARSGDCEMDCRFCSQSRRATTPIEAFPMLSAEALSDRLEALGRTPVAKIGVVTSGGALSGAEFETVRTVVEACSESLNGRICGSLGRLPADALVQLREAGISRFHHNMEASEAFYGQICSTQTWESRLRTVRRAQNAGLPVCSGGLFGMGESWEDRIDLTLRLRDEGVDNMPINFLTPHPGTELGDRAPMTPEEALRVIAVFRHILPTATLRICGGRPAALGDRQADMFRAGANALMTGDYLTTRGSALEADLAMIAAQGLRVAAPS